MRSHSSTKKYSDVHIAQFIKWREEGWSIGIIAAQTGVSAAAATIQDLHTRYKRALLSTAEPAQRLLKPDVPQDLLNTIGKGRRVRSLPTKNYPPQVIAEVLLWLQQGKTAAQISVSEKLEVHTIQKWWRKHRNYFSDQSP
jgi:precorrin-6B methylase 1